MSAELRNQLAAFNARRRRDERRFADLEDYAAEARLEGRAGEALRLDRAATAVREKIADLDVEIGLVEEQLAGVDEASFLDERAAEGEAELQEVRRLLSEALRTGDPRVRAAAARREAALAGKATAPTYAGMSEEEAREAIALDAVADLEYRRSKEFRAAADAKKGRMKNYGL